MLLAKCDSCQFLRATLESNFFLEQNAVNAMVPAIFFKATLFANHAWSDSLVAEKKELELENSAVGGFLAYIFIFC